MLSFRQFVGVETISEEIIKDDSGKPAIFLHGTTKDFVEFKPGKHKKDSQLGFGIHFTQEPKLANHYTGYQDVTKSGSKPGGNVKLVNLDVKKAFDQTKLYDVNGPEHQLAIALMKGTGRKPVVDGGKVYVNLDMVSPQKAEKTLRQFGYDAVIYDAIVGHSIFQGGRFGISKDIEAKAILVLDSSQVKPAFMKEDHEDGPQTIRGWMSPNGKVTLVPKNKEHEDCPPVKSLSHFLSSIQEKGHVRFGYSKDSCHGHVYYVHYDANHPQGHQTALKALRYMNPHRSDPVLIMQQPGNQGLVFNYGKRASAAELTLRDADEMPASKAYRFLQNKIASQNEI